MALNIRGTEVGIEPLVIATISTWESVALTTRPLGLRVPTVTDTVMKLPRPIRGILIGLTATWLVLHFEVIVRTVEAAVEAVVDP